MCSKKDNRSLSPAHLHTSLYTKEPLSFSVQPSQAESGWGSSHNCLSPGICGTLWGHNCGPHLRRKGKASGNLPLPSRQQRCSPKKSILSLFGLLSLRWELFSGPSLPPPFSTHLPCRLLCPCCTWLRRFGACATETPRLTKHQKDAQEKQAFRQEGSTKTTLVQSHSHLPVLLLHYTRIVQHQKYLELSESLPWAWKTKWETIVTWTWLIWDLLTVDKSLSLHNQ